MSQSIFIIIDPQNDFTHPEGDYARRHPGRNQIVAAKENINRLLAGRDSAHFLILQSDYRPHQFGEGLFMCIPGTFGHELDKDLNLHQDSTLIVKTEHSAFSSEAFRAHLQRNDIDTLVICGFLAEYCVQQTALDALALGYMVHLPVDCIGTGDDVQHRKQQMLEDLRQKGAYLTSSGEL